ncbi:MAG: TetR/AcrR family transcriptional regulator [Coriobacteriales bacterium]|jgi:AcrR family transcriptional regulator|nr:TetR/AcrR family transcriptional regulator [Coriobacteriales bacterium]
MVRRIVKPVEERRQEILSTARRLFIENGYKNTSVADIAKELGIAQGLVFHYFKTKAALLYSVFDEIATEGQLATRTIIEQHSGPVIDCLPLVLAQGQQFRNYDLLYSELAGDPAIHEYLQDKLSRQSIPLTVEIIKRGNADGSWNCDYPEGTAVFLIEGLSGLFHKSTDYNYDSAKDFIVYVLVRLLGINAQVNIFDGSSSLIGSVSDLISNPEEKMGKVHNAPTEEHHQDLSNRRL